MSSVGPIKVQTELGAVLSCAQCIYYLVYDGQYFKCAAQPKPCWLGATEERFNIVQLADSRPNKGCPYV